MDLLFLLHPPQQTFVPHQSVLSLIHVYDVIWVNIILMVCFLKLEVKTGMDQSRFLPSMASILMRRVEASFHLHVYLLAVRRKAVDGGGCTQQVSIMCKVNIATGIELISDLAKLKHIYCSFRGWV